MESTELIKFFLWYQKKKEWQKKQIEDTGCFLSCGFFSLQNNILLRNLIGMESFKLYDVLFDTNDLKSEQ